MSQVAEPLVNLSRDVAGDLKHRKNVSFLSDAELAALRLAYTKVMQIADDRGYQYWAGIHGLPLPISCKHSPENGYDSLFLPWHRAYLYFFEKALQDQVPGVTLPWWDWASAESHTEGIPAAYAVPNLDGSPNPLHQGPITAIPKSQWDAFRQALTEQGQPDPGDLPTVTVRDPDDPANLPAQAFVSQLTDRTTGPSTFKDFSQIVEVQLHNNVHGWVGGFMTDIPVAAYDPIFWAHHCMVDRLWWLWQLNHPGVVDLDPGFLSTALDPFPKVTVADLLNINDLGYDYAVAEVLVPGA